MIRTSNSSGWAELRFIEYSDTSAPTI